MTFLLKYCFLTLFLWNNITHYGYKIKRDPEKKDRYELLGFRLLRFVTCVFGDILGAMCLYGEACFLLCHKRDL